jgi:hypothetical protein
MPLHAWLLCSFSMLLLIPTLAIIYRTQSVARNPLQGHEKLCMESIQIIDTKPADLPAD